MAGIFHLYLQMQISTKRCTQLSDFSIAAHSSLDSSSLKLHSLLNNVSVSPLFNDYLKVETHVFPTISTSAWQIPSVCLTEN